jgi:hypothetical protein
VKDAVFVPQVLTHIHQLELVTSEELIKGILAKAWKEMGISNPRCPCDFWGSRRVPVGLIGNIQNSVLICVCTMNNNAILKFCTFSALYTSI